MSRQYRSGERSGSGRVRITPETPDDAWREPTNRAVDELAEYARALVGESASLERQPVGGGLPTLWIEPVNARSRSVAIIGEQWLTVNPLAGRNGTRASSARRPRLTVMRG